MSDNSSSLDGQWRKSSRSSANGACIEVRQAHRSVAVRDSKTARGPQLAFAVPAWRGFLAAVSTGTLDRG